MAKKTNVAAFSLLLIGAGIFSWNYGIRISKDNPENNYSSLLIGVGIILIFIAIVINVFGMMKKNKSS